MSYQWIEDSVTYHRSELMHEAEQDRLIALARGSRQPWAWAPSRVRLAQALRALARVIEPREQRPAPATGCVTC